MNKILLSGEPTFSLESAAQQGSPVQSEIPCNDGSLVTSKDDEIQHFSSELDALLADDFLVPSIDQCQEDAMLHLEPIDEAAVEFHACPSVVNSPLSSPFDESVSSIAPDVGVVRQIACWRDSPVIDPEASSWPSGSTAPRRLQSVVSAAVDLNEFAVAAQTLVAQAKHIRRAEKRKRARRPTEKYEASQSATTEPITPESLLVGSNVITHKVESDLEEEPPTKSQRVASDNEVEIDQGVVQPLQDLKTENETSPGSLSELSVLDQNEATTQKSTRNYATQSRRSRYLKQMGKVGTISKVLQRSPLRTGTVGGPTTLWDLVVRNTRMVTAEEVAKRKEMAEAARLAEATKQITSTEDDVLADLFSDTLLNSNSMNAAAATTTEEIDLFGSADPFTSGGASLRLGLDGNLLLEDTTPIIEQSDHSLANIIEGGNVVAENFLDMQTVKPFPGAYKSTRGTRWSTVDEDKFFQAIEMYGLDFTLVRTVIPHYTYKQIKDKYKIEERKINGRFDSALNKRLPLQLTQFEANYGKVVNPENHYRYSINDESDDDTFPTIKKSITQNTSNAFEGLFGGADQIIIEDGGEDVLAGLQTNGFTNTTNPFDDTLF